MSEHGCVAKRIDRVLLGVIVVAIGWTIPASAQTLIVVDDTYGVPFGEDLVVEAPGVLDNDTYDNEPAEDAGASVEFIAGATDGDLVLYSDGSFSYAPGVDFTGTDSFTYRATAMGQTGVATVELSACGAGPTVFSCWMEAPYLAKLAEFDIGTFQEGFEDDAAWGSVRTPFTAPSVVSQGIEWKTNHPDAPASNEITTGGGAAQTGLWGAYDPDHGYATGSSTDCDIDNPPVHCLYKDGLTGVRQPGESTLYGVGGHFTGSLGPNLVMILDGGAPIGLGQASAGYQFFGVIDTGGFTTFRFEDVDGKIGQARYVWADDFTFGTGTVSEIFSDGFESGDTTSWTTTTP